MSLFAQPGTNIINLGGEDPTVGPLKPPPVSQVAEPAAWLTDLLEGDTLKYISSTTTFFNKYRLEKVDNPGKIEAYKTLNIFTFLEDQRALQDYLMHRVYESDPVSTRSRSSRTNSERSVRTREGVRRSQQTERLATQGGRSGTSNTLSTAGSTDNRTALRTYPVVRQFAVGSFGLTPNPKYLPKPGTTGTLDASYVDAFNRFTNLLELYDKALVNPTAGNNPGSPVIIPKYFFDANRKQLSIDLPYAANRLGAAVKGRMTKEYISRNRGAWRSPVFRAKPWPAADVEEITAKMAVTPLSRSDKEQLGQTINKLMRQMRSLRLKQQSLIMTYRDHGRLLTEQEIIFFKWLLRSGSQLIADVSAPLEYMGAVNALPLEQTNYAQLLTAADLLRQAHERFNNLAYEAEAQAVLKKITALYYREVMVSSQFFQQKQRN